MNKNKTQLASFVKYCKEHPEERFWQAIRNWSKSTFNPRIQYVLTAELDINDPKGYRNLRDTFYDA